MKRTFIMTLAFLMPAFGSSGPLLPLAGNALATANLSALHKLKPNHLVLDLNGDGAKDHVLLVEDRATKKAGLCILYSGNAPCVRIGAGKRFHAAGDDFRWVDYWEIIPSGETWEATFSADGDVAGERKVNLENESVRLCADEGGCGVIAFKRGAHVWVHQGD